MDIRKIEHFINCNGLKTLALAPFSSLEYSIIVYLLHLAFVDSSATITTTIENLIRVFDCSETEINKTLERLGQRHYLQCFKKETSIQLALELDPSKWQIEDKVNSKSELLFSSSTPISKKFELLSGKIEKKDFSLSSPTAPGWRKVLDAFCTSNDISKEKIEKHIQSAKQLVERYPVDQILILIRHFSGRLSKLDILVNSWIEYQKKFEQETQEINLIDARLKHLELDAKLKECASEFLKKSEKIKLNPNELEVLTIFMKHRYPRRQLFWAYQARSDYPHLKEFFKICEKFMIPVTSRGKVVLKPSPKQD